MRRIIVAGFCALALCATAGPARAALFFVDQFNYADGQLTTFDGTDAFAGDNVSGGAWTTYSPLPPATINTGSITMAGGKAVLNQPSTEDAERAIPNAGTDFQTPGETWYFAALVTVFDERPDLATSIQKEYFMLVKDTSPSALRSRLYVDNPTVAGTAGYRLAIGASSGANNAVNYPTDLAFGTQYTVVVSYEHDTGYSSLWVNPTSPASASVTGTAGASPRTFISALALRQAFFGAGAANTEIHIGALSYGDSFADVLAAVVPEPGSATLGLSALAGLAAFRRRRS